jgi:FkbM family methyltransferase
MSKIKLKKKFFKFLKSIVKNLLLKFNLILLFKEDYLKIDLQNLKKTFLKDTSLNSKLTIENLLSHFFKNHKDSKGQLMQDLFVDYILNKKNGLFVEVGACDGLTHSNTYWLEKHRYWSGILCEPASFWHKELFQNRPNCILEKRPIFSEPKKIIYFNTQAGGRSFIQKETEPKKENVITLESISLNQLFLDNNLSKIDYLSIDTEGSEFEILKNLDFNKFRPCVITIEHNYEKIKRNKIFDLLTKNNYLRVFKQISRFDDWYIDKNII